MPYVEIVMLNVQFAQDEILLWTRLSKISSYLFRSGRDFLVLTFTGWHYWSRRPIMDESGVWTFSSIINYILYLSLNSKKVLRLTLSLRNHSHKNQEAVWWFCTSFPSPKTIFENDLALTCFRWRDTKKGLACGHEIPWHDIVDLSQIACGS